MKLLDRVTIRVVRFRAYINMTAVGLFGSAFAQAGLPTVAAPEGEAADGDFLQLLQDYAAEFAIFGGLVLSALAFFVVAKNVITTYNDVPSGRATMGGVAVHSGVGVLLLVVVVYLMNEAAAIL